MSSRLPATPSTTSRPLEPCGVVIFGATGDLAARKLLPGLYDLFHEKRLPEPFFILGCARREWGAEKFRDQARAAVAEHSRFRPPPPAGWEAFAASLRYQPLEAGDPSAYGRLRARLEELHRQCGTRGNVVFYLAIAPELYPPVVDSLGAAGLAGQASGWTRIIIEKPFGHDPASARRLNAQVQNFFAEPQVYRIDHYLGKETVQNLAVLRFANGIFEPLWNRKHIDHVQITVAEDLGVEHRAGFYETAGAVRDMIQNHLLQLLCLVAMEPPSSFEATPVQEEKAKVLHCIRPLDTRGAVRGQYGSGRIHGKEVVGYRQEEGVRPDSSTETFAAIRFELENWRWAGVPFYVRTGKRLPRKVSEIAIQFREAPLHLFACTALQPCPPNLLSLRIQPDEGIGLRVLAKTPGLEVVGRSVQLDFSYGADFEVSTPTAYESLLLDCLEGDRMLFARADWVERAWELLDPLLKAWAAEPSGDFPNYAAGSWGPAGSEELIRRDGRRWHLD